MIVKRGGKYFVDSADGTKVLGGPFDTEAEAVKRLGQVEHYKARGDRADVGAEAVTRFDALVSLAPAKRMDNGWVEVDAVITRSGVFRYRNPDGSPRLEYRPPEEVGRADSLASFELTPVTDDHPDTVYPERPSDNGLLRAANTSAYARGAVASVRRDGDLVRARLRVTDERTIAKMDAGKVATSCGYTCRYDATPGVAPDGTRYDGVQRDIRGNHVAIVDVGRAGPEARVRMDAAGHAIDVPESLTGRDSGDTLPLATLMPTGDAMNDTEKLQAAAKDAIVRADKAEADLKSERARADKAEAAAEELKLQVAKLSAVRTDSEQIGELKTKLDTAITELEAERAARKIAEDPNRFAAAVQRRAKIESAATRILGKEFRADKSTDRAIMLAVVEKVSGAIDASRSDEYVESRFDNAIEGWERGEAALAQVRAMVTSAPAARQDAALPDTRSPRDKMIAHMNTLIPVSK